MEPELEGGCFASATPSNAAVDILQSWGVASARSTSGFPVFSGAAGSCDSEYLYDVPIGPSVVRWDLTSQKRVMQFQAHTDLVTCARKSPDQTLIASSSYSGDVKLWSSQWVCFAKTKAPMESQFHLAWSPDSQRFLIIGNGKNSSMVVYTVSTSKGSRPALHQEWTLPAKDCPGSLSIAELKLRTRTEGGNSSSSLETETLTAVTVGDPSHDYPSEEAFFMAEFNPSGNIFAIEEVPYRSTLVHLISPDGGVLRTADLLAMIGDWERGKRSVNTVFISSHHNGVYAVGLEVGRIALVDAEQLQVSKSFKVGSGFRAAVWDRETLVVPSDSGKVMWWDKHGNKVCEFESCMQDHTVHMDWSMSGNGLWICGFSCMAYLAIERSDDGVVKGVTPTLSVSCHELTSVGVGFDPSGCRLGSGDMVGTVWVTEKDRVTPLHTFSVGVSVRCLTWLDVDRMLVGTLDGCIHWWKVGDQQPQSLLQLQGSIITMHFNSNHKLLAVGTSKGMLCVYQLIKLGKEDLSYRVVVVMKAHLPQLGPQDQRFGQLGKQAEIWSLCWSPDDTKLATCSEDQTVKVWSTECWKCLASLEGHTLAVTSVDWMQQGRWNLLASCSDDRTVRLTNGDNYELLCVVDTEDIHGWHTLTYLTFYSYDESFLLVCTTQNGHLVVWSVDQGSSHGALRRVWKGKVHLGSVEGLAWQGEGRGGHLATVGSDCIVNLFKIML